MTKVREELIQKLAQLGVEYRPMPGRRQLDRVVKRVKLAIEQL